MLAWLTETLENWLSEIQDRSSRLPRSAARRGTRRMGPEVLEDRLALSHTALSLAPVALAPAKNAIVQHEAENAANEDHVALHSNPASVAARLALEAQQALAKEAEHAVQVHAPSPSVSTPPVDRTPAPTSPPSKPAPAPVNPPTNEQPPRTALPPGPMNPVVVPGPLTPAPVHTPIPSPIPGPGTGESPAFNPTDYIPELCTKATFSGIMGPDGHYSSFTIVGTNPATNTIVTISYATGTPFGSPVYYWSINIHDPSIYPYNNPARRSLNTSRITPNRD